MQNMYFIEIRTKNVYFIYYIHNKYIGYAYC
jgi:hypothetical protein